MFITCILFSNLIAWHRLKIWASSRCWSLASGCAIIFSFRFELWRAHGLFLSWYLYQVHPSLYLFSKPKSWESYLLCKKSNWTIFCIWIGKGNMAIPVLWLFKMVHGLTVQDRWLHHIFVNICRLKKFWFWYYCLTISMPCI